MEKESTYTKPLKRWISRKMGIKTGNLNDGKLILDTIEEIIQMEYESLRIQTSTISIFTSSKNFSNLPKDWKTNFILIYVYFKKNYSKILSIVKLEKFMMKLILLDTILENEKFVFGFLKIVFLLNFLKLQEKVTNGVNENDVMDDDEDEGENVEMLELVKMLKRKFFYQFERILETIYQILNNLLNGNLIEFDVFKKNLFVFLDIDDNEDEGEYNENERDVNKVNFVYSLLILLNKLENERKREILENIEVKEKIILKLTKELKNKELEKYDKKDVVEKEGEKILKEYSSKYLKELEKNIKLEKKLSKIHKIEKQLTDEKFRNQQLKILNDKNENKIKFLKEKEFKLIERIQVFESVKDLCSSLVLKQTERFQKERKIRMLENNLKNNYHLKSVFEENEIQKKALEEKINEKDNKIKQLIEEKKLIRTNKDNQLNKERKKIIELTEKIELCFFKNKELNEKFKKKESERILKISNETESEIIRLKNEIKKIKFHEEELEKIKTRNEELEKSISKDLNQKKQTKQWIKKWLKKKDNLEEINDKKINKIEEKIRELRESEFQNEETENNIKKLEIEKKNLKKKKSQFSRIKSLLSEEELSHLPDKFTLQKLIMEREESLTEKEKEIDEIKKKVYIFYTEEKKLKNKMVDLRKKNEILIKEKENFENKTNEKVKQLTEENRKYLFIQEKNQEIRNLIKEQLILKEKELKVYKTEKSEFEKSGVLPKEVMQKLKKEGDKKMNKIILDVIAENWKNSRIDKEKIRHLTKKVEVFEKEQSNYKRLIQTYIQISQEKVQQQRSSLRQKIKEKLKILMENEINLDGVMEDVSNVGNLLEEDNEENNEIFNEINENLEEKDIEEAVLAELKDLDSLKKPISELTEVSNLYKKNI